MSEGELRRLDLCKTTKHHIISPLLIKYKVPKKELGIIIKGFNENLESYSDMPKILWLADNKAEVKRRRNPAFFINRVMIWVMNSYLLTDSELLAFKIYFITEIK